MILSLIFFLIAGISLNLTEDGETALHCAAHIVQILLKCGADVKSTDIDEDGNTDMVYRVYILSGGYKYWRNYCSNKILKSDLTSCHYAAKHGHFIVSQCLHTMGVDINTPNIANYNIDASDDITWYTAVKPDLNDVYRFLKSRSFQCDDIGCEWNNLIDDLCRNNYNTTYMIHDDCSIIFGLCYLLIDESPPDSLSTATKRLVWSKSEKISFLKYKSTESLLLNTVISTQTMEFAHTAAQGLIYKTKASLNTDEDTFMRNEEMATQLKQKKYLFHDFKLQVQKIVLEIATGMSSVVTGQEDDVCIAVIVGAAGVIVLVITAIVDRSNKHKRDTATLNERNFGSRSKSGKLSFRQNKVSLLSILLLLININTVSAQTPVFLVHPNSTAAISDGRQVEFTCTVENATLALTYAVNNAAAAEQEIIDKGFMESAIETLGGNVRRRNLTVTVSSALNNNSEIHCIAFGLGGNVNSDIATLTVQGPLSLVSNLSYTYIDSSTVNISWSPPFTLPGTYITGYNISVTSNGTITDYFTSNTNYELLLTDITNSSCNEINITVSGYNGLNGENSSTLAPSSEVTNPISIEIGNSLELGLKLNLSQQCDEYFPSLLMIDLLTNNTLVNNTVINSTAIYEDDDLVVIEDLFILNKDELYTVIVSYDILNGSYTVVSNTTFSTFGIESVNITDTTDGRVCLECIFSSFSSDTGCTVVLVSSTDSTVQYNETYNRLNNTITANGCISNVITGIYTVTIYNSHGVIQPLLISNINVTLPVLSTSTVSSTITMSTTTSSGTTSNSDSFSPISLTMESVVMQTGPGSDGGVSDGVIGAIVGAIVGFVVIVFIIIFIVAIVVVIVVKHKQDKATWSVSNSQMGTFFPSRGISVIYSSRKKPVIDIKHGPKSILEDENKSLNSNSPVKNKQDIDGIQNLPPNDSSPPDNEQPPSLHPPKESPPTDDKPPPTDDKPPPTDDKTPPTDDKTPPTDDKTPPTNDKTPPISPRIYPSEETETVNDTDEHVVPYSNDTTDTSTSTQGVSPSESITKPPNDTTIVSKSTAEDKPPHLPSSTDHIYEDTVKYVKPKASTAIPPELYADLHFQDKDKRPLQGISTSADITYATPINPSQPPVPPKKGK